MTVNVIKYVFEYAKSALSLYYHPNYCGAAKMTNRPNVIGGSTNASLDTEFVSKDPSPQSGQGNANLIYILFILNAIIPFLGIVGFVMANSARNSAPPNLQSHYDNQIKIFWVSVAGYIASIVLAAFVIGFLVFPLVFIWKLTRTITGMNLLGRGAPVQNLKSLNFICT